jgi:glycosyltransferase involved in cell wall biosynthesis
VADVFVLPSVNEPWGLVVNEVMCAGVPVLSTREIGAAADLVIDGQTGFTFDAGDTDALAQLLRKVIADQALRKALSANAVARMNQWSYAECLGGLRLALGVH